MMASDINSKQVLGLAAGVGHVYCGRVAKGLLLYFAWLLVPVCVTISALIPPSNASLVLLVFLPVIVVVAVYVYAAIDAWRLARQIGADYSLCDFNRIAVYGLMIFVQMVYSMGLIAGTCSIVFEPFYVPTNSMNPTILAGDRIMVRKLLAADQDPERGSVVVFNNPTDSVASAFVMRVVAVSGDKIELIGDRVLINGEELGRELVAEEDLAALGDQVRGEVEYEDNSGHRYWVAYGDAPEDAPAKEDLELVVPKGQVFVMGDNRDRSLDSRHFGAIPVGEIIGYIQYNYWPAESWSRFGVANYQLP